MEKLDFRLRSSLAKSIGTMVSIAGALMVTLYKGLPIAFAASPHNLHHELHASVQSNWLIGVLLLAAACFCFALLLIVQVESLQPLCVIKNKQKPRKLKLFLVFHIQRPGSWRPTLQCWCKHSFVALLWPPKLPQSLWLRRKTRMLGD